MTLVSDIEMLVDLLVSVPPVELEGLALLRRYQPTPGQWFPNAPLGEVVPATLQFIDYCQKCQATIERLTDLRPVPLAIPILEYGL